MTTIRGRSYGTGQLVVIILLVILVVLMVLHPHASVDYLRDMWHLFWRMIVRTGHFLKQLISFAR